MMISECVGKDVDIYSGEDIFRGKIISLQSDALVYKDEERKHLLPSSRFSFIVFKSENITYKIKKEKKKIFLRFLVINGSIFVLGMIIGILIGGM